MKNSLKAWIVIGLGCGLGGCAALSSVVAGSKDWFEDKRPDLTAKASADLGCAGQPIDFVSTAGGDYREVEAHGCGKKAAYKWVKIGPVGNWAKSSEATPM